MYIVFKKEDICGEKEKVKTDQYSESVALIHVVHHLSSHCPFDTLLRPSQLPRGSMYSLYCKDLLCVGLQTIAALN